MATNSNYYGYSTGVQQPQVYGNPLQGQQVAQTGYSAQTSTGYGATTGVATAASPYGAPAVSPARVTPQAAQQTAYGATTSYPQTALSGSSYGYTARAQETTGLASQSYQTSGGYNTSQAPSSYYDRSAVDTTGSTGAAAAGYDSSKSTSYYGQTPSQQSYGYGQTTPSQTKSTLYSSQQNQYSSPGVGAQASAQKSQTGSNNTSNVSGNVSYPYSTGKQHYNHGSGGGNYSSNWSNNSNNMSQQSGNDNYQQPQAYDAAVYNAASSYFQQHQPPRQKWNRNQNNNSGNKPQQQRQKMPPKQQQVHYCEVCKISCAGPQTYKEHLEGQKHKKKETAVKLMEASDGYKCTLCDISCTGADAFNAHLKGAKHLKTMKLHTKLGKPIPDIPSAEVQDKDKKKDDTPKEQTPRNFRNQARKRKPTAPKITFIGGSQLNLSGETTPAAAGDGSSASPATSSAPATPTTPTTPADGEKKEGAEVKEVKPIGLEYVEEMKAESGKITGFECKLCECKFNDVLAREAHCAGRRHKLTYKKKVQPDYVVDVKPANKGRQQHRSLMDDKARKKWEQEVYWKKQEANWRQEEVRSNVGCRWGEEEYWRRLEEEERMWEEQEQQRHEASMMDWAGRGQRMGPPPGGFAPPDMFGGSRPKVDSQDDRLVMAKHKSIYPNEQELVAVQNIVSAVEKALKLVSDKIAEEDAPAKPIEGVKMETEAAASTPAVAVEEKPEEKKEAEEDEAKKTETPKAKSEPPLRTLKGVMRVGVLAKGLLLHERLDVELVVLCQERPSKVLLNRVYSKLPEHLLKVTEEKYDVSLDQNTIVIGTTKDPAIKIVITLTSPAMRDDADAAEEHKDVLDKEKCLEALASLRHAKWFQAKANGVPSCVIVIRLLRDMRDRIPAFAPLSSWAMELLVEKCLSSADRPLGPGEAFRRVIECISSGVVLPGGVGLQDPCEKETTDAARVMTAQEREELTASAQHCLRLHAFRQLHTVLGIEPLPPPKFKPRFGRGGGARFKRRREDNGTGGDGSAKKEKKDGEPTKGTEQATTEDSATPAAAADTPTKAAETTEAKS